MLHRIEPRRPELLGLLTALYRESFTADPATPHFRPDGNRDTWALDLRRGLSQSVFLTPVAREMGRLIQDSGVAQIAGSGYGSAFLLGGLLAVHPDFRGGIIRDAAKLHGFRRRLEGSLQPGRPVFLVDDVLSSGRSAAAALSVLREHDLPAAGLVVVFRYGWRRPEERLHEFGIPIYALATLFPSSAEPGVR